jgi:hypothetical protein
MLPQCILPSDKINRVYLNTKRESESWYSPGQGQMGERVGGEGGGGGGKGELI